MTKRQGPGRPRDPNVQARDELVYRTIANGTTTRAAIANATGHNRDAVFLSCKRLRDAGRIQPTLGPNGTRAWTTTT